MCVFVCLSQSGLTPLHVASFMGHTAIVTYLLENGAQTETATMRGETAFHLAARANQIEVMRILIRARANVDARAKVRVHCTVCRVFYFLSLTTIYDV